MEYLLVSWHEETCVVNLLEAVKYRNSCQDLWDLSSCVNTYWLLHTNPQQSTLVNSWVVRLFVSIQVSSVLIPQTTIFQFLLSTKLLRIDSQVFFHFRKIRRSHRETGMPGTGNGTGKWKSGEEKIRKEIKRWENIVQCWYSWSFIGWKNASCCCHIRLSFFYWGNR